MDYPPGQEPVALGLDCGSGLPADSRAACVEWHDALAAGIRHIDVGEGEHPAIGQFLRDVHRDDLSIIVRLHHRAATEVATTVAKVQQRLGVDRLDYCLVPAEHVRAAGALDGLVRSGAIAGWGVWDPPESFLPVWRSGVAAALSYRSDLSGFGRLNPYVWAAGGRPVFVRWDPRLPRGTEAVPPSVIDAAMAAGLSLQSLAIGIPLYTRGISAVLLPASEPGEVRDLIRGATLVNPDSILMREFLDSSFLKAPQC